MLKKVEVLKSCENKHTRFVYRSDNIVEVYCASNYEYEVKDLKENILMLRDNNFKGRAKVLNIVPVGTSISKAAREFLAEGPHSEYLSAEAFVISSFTQQLTANFYMKINKPLLPTKFFVKIEEAVEWLTSIND